MMAVWVSSGALLLVMLTGTSYSYPAKQGFDPSSSYSSSYGANPASTGSTWAVPASGFAPAGSGSGAASKTVSYPARPQAAPRRELNYPPPSVQREPAPAYSSSSSSYSAPVYSGYANSAPAASAPPGSFQSTSTEDIPWVVAPPHPFSAEDTTRRPSARRVGLNKPALNQLSPSNVSPPGPSPPEYQAGELSHYGSVYEHGNYELETEEQNFQPSPPSVQALNVQDSKPRERQSSGPGRSWAEYPYFYDYMFLTGQYPQGTYTHSSSSFEQGNDHWQENHYIRDYFPANPGVQQVKIFPNFEAPQKVQRPIQPVKQSTGKPSFGVGTGQNQPYEAVGLQDSYFQPSGFEQPRYPSPAGGYRLSKVGN